MNSIHFDISKNFFYLLSKSLFFGLFVSMITACSSIIDARKQKQPYIGQYYSGKVALAAQSLTEKSEEQNGTGDELMWLLEAGTANFTANNYQKSLYLFEQSEHLIQDFDNRAVINARSSGSEVGSMVTNLNALPYQGMYVDRVMLNAYKALDYFSINQPDSAQVELRRMREAQKQVVRQFADEIRHSQQQIKAQVSANQKKSRSLGNQNIQIPFSSIVKNPVVNKAYQVSASKENKYYGNLANPFVSYFSALGYLMDNNYSEALVDFRNLYRMNPNNRMIQRDYVTVAKQIANDIPKELADVTAYPYALNHKIVYIVLFNGRAPALKQEKFQIILPYIGYTGVAFPRYEYFPAVLSGLDIQYNLNKQQLISRTEQIADFDAIMSQEYHDKLPTMITRLVLSTLSKEMASYAAVSAARRSSGEVALITYLLTGLYKYMFNTADTRSWETLPKEVQISHIPMPDEGLLSIHPRSILDKATDQKRIEIRVKQETNIAIVYIRALSANKLIYKLIEL